MNKYAYAAGLIDGEGSITLPKNGHGGDTRIPCLAVTMCDPEPIEFMAQFGGFIRQLQPKGNRQLRHIWQIKGNKALDLLEELDPFLVIRRRKEITRLLIDKYPRDKGGGGLRLGRAQITNRLFSQMKTINARREPNIYVPRTKHKDYEAAAYAAGIIDGEGWINEKSPHCEVWSTDPELIGWLQHHFSGAAYVTKPSPKPPRKQTYSWRIYKENVASFALQVEGLVLLPRKANLLSKYVLSLSPT